MFHFIRSKKGLSGISLIATSLVFSAGTSAVDFQAGETKVSVYGFAKLDLLYDVGDIRAGTSGMGKSVGYTNIALDGQTTTSGHSDLHANSPSLRYQQGIDAITLQCLMQLLGTLILNCFYPHLARAFQVEGTIVNE